MIYKILLSPQVKQYAIITYEHGTYKVSCQYKSLVNTSKNSWKADIKLFL